MVNLNKEFFDFTRREITVRPGDFFPNYDFRWVVKEFGHNGNGNEDKSVFEVVKDLASGGYEKIFNQFGFWENGNEKLGGHCHQFTPALGVVLDAMGYKTSYLEGYMVDSEHLGNGNLVKVDPRVEQGPLREDFIRIGRIPYCALEVRVNGKVKLISPKHLTVDCEGNALAGLTPECYEQMSGVFVHQYDPRISGIYLQRYEISLEPTPPGFDSYNGVFPIWRKQKLPRPGEETESAEFFATFLRMNIVRE